MPKAIVSFEDFTGGEFGLLGEVHAPRNTFTGSNVMRLVDGSLARRSGLVDLGVTGVPSGVVGGFGVHPYQSMAWFVVGDEVYDFSLSATGQAARLLGTLDTTPTTRIRSTVNVGVSTYISVYNDKVYVLDHVAGTLTAIAGSPGGRCVALYADRMLVAGVPTSRNRVHFSRWRNFTDWPTASYTDLGSSDYPVIALFGATHRLYAAKTDDSWWTLAGIPPISEKWVKTARGLRPGDATNGATRWALAGGGDHVWFAPESLDYPVLFTGGDFKRYEYLSLTNLSGDYADAGFRAKVGMAGLAFSDDLAMVTGANGSTYDDQGLIYHRGAWTKHNFGVGVSGWIDGREDINRRLIISDAGSSTTAAKFYAWSYDINRPAFSGETWESATDSGVAIPASFTLPEFIDPKLNEISLTGVVVDFRKWNHGFGGNNSFTVTVTPTHRNGQGDGTSKSTPWTEAATAATSAGTSDSQRLTFDVPGFASGFRLNVSNIVGVAIDRLHLFYDTRPVQGI